jgi:DNA-binding NarL/FixJ family response regulator
MKPITVLIVEDHKVIADGLEHLINSSDMVQVVGKAYTATACRQMLAADLHPDVVMLDIGLPDGNGIDICAEIKHTYPQQKILMLTSYGDLATITRAMNAGADGYVLKNAMPEELLEGIRTVAGGEQFLCMEADIVVKKSHNNNIELTRREMELLSLIVEGYTLPQLMDKMCLGYETIRSYRKNLNIKLDAHNTAQLIQNAKAMKLV